MEGEGDAGPSAAYYSSTSSPLPPRSSGSPDASSAAPLGDLNQCDTWDDARDFLQICGVPDAQLQNWEALWRWDQLKERKDDLTAPNQLVLEFCQRVEGTREDWECFVPEREGRKGHLCLKVVGRRQRMESHMCSDHLGDVRPFQCLGQCGRVDWEKFLQLRYLHQHVNPVKVSCPQCAKVIHKRNMSTHRCLG